jgi:molybdopterin synthase catalytic subunit
VEAEVGDLHRRGRVDMPVILTAVVEDPIDVQSILAAVEHPSCGATVLMTGQVRDHHEGRVVERVEYHAYLEMAEKELEGVAGEAVAGRDSLRIAVTHRLGELSLGEISVAVAVSAPHRSEAFDACRRCIDALKERLPVWKKEFGPEGMIWQEETPLMPGRDTPSPETPSGEEA